MQLVLYPWLWPIAKKSQQAILLQQQAVAVTFPDSQQRKKTSALLCNTQTKAQKQIRYALAAHSLFQPRLALHAVAATS